ncbi:MAG: hypothetical protein L3J33_06175 [Rhodobacteraceae bacterium]|nr:hypothetical protein [Paracoccaceae bacterium]
MNPPSRLLRGLLLLVSACFLAMAAAHFLGLKYPLLFVYYDTPYYAYQDRIIAATLLPYAVMFFATSRHKLLLPYALFALWITIFGLSYINLSDELALVITDQTTRVYWLQTAVFAALALVLTLLTLKEKP